jgi:hypothetical protein
MSDDNYVIILPFMLGVLAAFQSVHERYGRDVRRACGTLPGILYLGTRGILACLAFEVAWYYKLIGEPFLWMKAAACGAGSELFLRTQVYVRQAGMGSHTTEVLRGPFDILRWYANYFLEEMAAGLAMARKAFVFRHLPPGKKFLELCDLVGSNIPAWPKGGTRYGPRSEETARALEKLVKNARDKFVAERDAAGVRTPEAEHTHCVKLGFAILDRVGRTGFKTLFGPSL